MRSLPSAHQGAGPHQMPDLPAPWSWISQTPELREINVCYLSCPLRGILVTAARLRTVWVMFSFWSLVMLRILFSKRNKGANNLINTSINQGHWLISDDNVPIKPRFMINWNLYLRSTKQKLEVTWVLWLRTWSLTTKTLGPNSKRTQY